MAFVLSLALTGMLVSPIFMLAGWFSQPQAAPIHIRFNTITSRRR